MSRKRKLIVFLIAFALTLILMAFLAWWWMYTHPYMITRFLENSQPPEKVDLIVVISGDDIPRLAKAAELYKSGYAPKVLLSDFDCRQVHQFSTVNLIPYDDLIVTTGGSGTIGNATYSAPQIRACGARSVILVTSWYHSHRALQTFRHVMPDVRFISVPTRRASWPVTREALNLEFRKLCYYAIAYRISPF
ncbi:MAG: YdcF family protein [Candidatus Sumerlaeota bacterium]|nr:YdcF family protein [Candidatus Sumerlaeota bacterium]